MYNNLIKLTWKCLSVVGGCYEKGLDAETFRAIINILYYSTC